ncbi:hypothetical protein PVAND_008311 [Polypedilum vanderplanki]|uniref:Secreted protein n=1 Tax=Polypedilum vanderplanki TaxID=319348 RepID=A0A9J6C9T4_POLVA|nr:hypothetical protein PVAND_008311 [Polypedilum vanderplanki]
MMSKKCSLFIVVIFTVNLIFGLPVDKEEATTTEIPSDNSTNGTHKELYIIKATTYEIGILAEVPNDDNTTDDGPVTRQQVDLSFYDTKSNDSFINFGDVPLPVQTTSVNGQVITGIAPVHIGAVDDVEDVLKALPFTGTILNITQKDTSYIHLNRENLTEANQVVLNDKEDLAKLPILNNILLPDNFDQAFESVNKNATQ